MKMRIGHQGVLQVLLCLAVITKAVIDHAGMKKQPRILGAQLQCFT
jgi:hypothetical protein